jgi:uncharacterized protein with HEPN domain
MRDDRERLLDIEEAIERIERYASKGKVAFEQDELIQTWVVYHLQIVGEAAAKLTKGFKETNARIPWAQIIAMRNLLVHQYFGIDVVEVWQVVERDIPALKNQLDDLLRKQTP